MCLIMLQSCISKQLCASMTNLFKLQLSVEQGSSMHYADGDEFTDMLQALELGRGAQ